MTTSTELHYAPKPPLLRRTRVRAAITSAVVVAIASAALTWGKPAWQKVQMVYWQGQCMRHLAPPDRVVARSDIPAYVPQQWARFYQLLTSNGFQSAGTIFLHERTSPGGNRRLVVIDATAPNLCTGGARGIVRRVVVPASFLSKPREIIDLVALNDGPCFPWNTTFYAAQPDPDDPSHLVIEYEVAGQKQVMDGWLTDDDEVLLEHRAPPIALVTP